MSRLLDIDRMPRDGSNQQIAGALFITRKTASVHVSHILAELGARKRVDAVAAARRVDLDDGPRSREEEKPWNRVVI